MVFKTPEILNVKPISNFLYTGNSKNEATKSNTDLEASLRKILARIEDLLKPESVLENSISIKDTNKLLNYKMEIANVLRTYLVKAIGKSYSKSNLDFRNLMLNNLSNFNTIDSIVNIDCNSPYPNSNLLLESKTEENEKDFNVIPGKIGKENLSFLLDYTKNNKEWFDEKNMVAGYHTVSIQGETFLGQRDPIKRLGKVPYDFTNKRVLDVGCSNGGLLHALTNQIEFGVGVDFNSKCVNAANALKAVNHTDNIHFYTFDLDKEDL